MDTSDNDVSAAVEAGKDALECENRITEVVLGGHDAIPVALVRNGETLQPLTSVLAISDERAPAPRRRKGTANFHELASFTEHVNRFKDEHSVIFANIDAPNLTAVLDYHQKTAEGEPRWGQHRSVYALPLSDQWKVWTASDQQKMKQEVFAQFIEDHLDDLRGPTGNGEDKGLPFPTDMLTMARHLVIHTKGEYQRKINPSNGDSVLICKYENESSSTKIPEAFMLGLPVFRAGPIWPVKARLRLEMTANGPLFSYALYQPDETKRQAFDEVRTMAGQKTELPVLAGTPE